MNSIRITVDSNVFISGLLDSKDCKTVFTAFKRHKFVLIISSVLFQELLWVLARPKFNQITNKEEGRDVLNSIKDLAIFVEPSQPISVCRDIKDNKVLECAVEGQCQYLVTRDQDLLILKDIQKIPIITPKEFMKILSEESTNA